MLAIGGPCHGNFLEGTMGRDVIDVPVPIKRPNPFADWPPEPSPEPTYQTVRYERLVIVTRSGQRIPVWVVE